MDTNIHVNTNTNDTNADVRVNVQAAADEAGMGTAEASGRAVRGMVLTGTIGNVFLSAFKLLAGMIGRSGAMISDAVHSLSDVLATMIAGIGLRLAQRSADSDHPYGHERFEPIASILLSGILFITGAGIGYTAIRNISSGTSVIPGRIALIAAIVSIVVKEAMFWYTRHYALKIHSSVFMADAWHHRSDALSSVGSLIGIAGARLGFPVLDPIASLIICLFIWKVAFDTFRTACSQLVDTAAPQELEDAIRQEILTVPGVDGIDLLQTRRFGERFYVDVEIQIDGNKTLTEAHETAQEVHDRIERSHSAIKHVMVHMNPAECA